jgi:hypothetical protein
MGGWAMCLFSGGGIWLYLLATIVAGATGGGLFSMLNPLATAEPCEGMLREVVRNELLEG